MQKDNYVIRVMAPHEVNTAIDWAAAEGWNPGLHDAPCFHAADPNGFLVGLLDGEPVATISVVRYGDSFGFLGFYIVKPEYRGQGYGVRIWKAGLAYLEGRVIGLDGVVAQQDSYRNSGFQLAYNNIRYQGTGGGCFPAGAGIVPLSTLSFDEVRAYDQPFFPADRTQFLRRWIDPAQGAALGIVQDGKLAGYGVLRACRAGYKIGPLFGDSPQLAQRLFLALKAQASGNAPVFLDIPQVNVAAIDMAKRHAMTPVFETARMYTGQVPRLPMERLFGVTTFELG